MLYFRSLSLSLSAWFFFLFSCLTRPFFISSNGRAGEYPFSRVCVPPYTRASLYVSTSRRNILIITDSLRWRNMKASHFRRRPLSKTAGPTHRRSFPTATDPQPTDRSTDPAVHRKTTQESQKKKEHHQIVMKKTKWEKKSFSGGEEERGWGSDHQRETTPSAPSHRLAT